MMELKDQDGAPMLDHLNKFQGILNQLSRMNIKFEDEIHGLWVLGTLPNSWEIFRASLSNSALNGILSMDLVKSSMLNEEMRRKSQSSYLQSDVLVTERRGRSRSKSSRGNSRSKSKSKSDQFANVECHYCHEKGHIKKYCRKLKRDSKNHKGKEKKNDDDSDTNTITVATEIFYILSDGDVVNLAIQQSSWVIDSSASIHATSKREVFASYTLGDFGSVRMGNDESANVVGIGDVHLKNRNGSRLILKCETYFRYSYELDFYRGHKFSSLYYMDAKIMDSDINTVNDEANVELWHKILSHMRKQMRVTFKSSQHSRKPNVLELVYSDVFGPMKTKSLEGALYFVTFTDDHSRQIWVYTLKTKDPVLQVFKQFHASIERETSEKLKYIRTDNGAFVHVPKDERSKLDAKTKPCVFLGYGQNEFGYRLYDPVGAEDSVQEQLAEIVVPTDVSVRRSVRDRRLSTRYSPNEYLLLTNGGKPKSYEEAIEDEHKREWNDAMKDEMESLHANHTLGKTALRNKWVYRIKQEHTSKLRYKARLVVKGFNQKKCIDFDEIFALLVKMSFIRVVLGLAASLDLEVEQMDVKTAFLHGDLDKEIYMEQPEDKEKEDMSEVPYASAAGSLMYAMEAVKCIMRYLRGTSSLKLTFGDGKPVLIGYTDSDMAGDIDSRKSTVGYFMTFIGGAASWQSRLQKCVALSTTEAEYIVATEACKEMLWMKRFIQKLGFKQQRYVIYCDNQSAIHLDMLTKNVPRAKLEFCRSTVRMKSSSSK
ncbi:Retrovirus-related Pol polyprotein from transposon TNT 1-94 [Cucumis melo var. makuwa]|uniref:Retrovirus-related Pol polyprotein from transposon TNT 1-94 n=1 Tax=Cucumis melo var. makuwa TaxID=1194695 RepID=A0A5A7U8K2_CUCMM|nr:Retrovirus-related Pol polyprotein from transposon TNT 1-94 [Cucumis melo var. makuwa]TYK30545.1 Retrovirus-related Pol polyprotein from transposon TNT 1-94 [Cucumis melo var. makuwa]